MKVLSKLQGLPAIIILLIISIPIFQFSIYKLLVGKIGIAYAYFIDQFLPLFITGILAFFVIRKYTSIFNIKRYLSANAISILIIIAVSILVHGWTLGNYFFGEEVNSILRPVNIGEVQTPLILRGWHLGIFVLSFEIFSTKVIFYNIIALILYILTAVLLYIFLNLLLNRKLPSLLGTLFFITTPSYMDLFSWQIHFSGTPIALSTGLLCLIFLLIFQKKNNFIFYFLSLLFYIALLKISFARFHGFLALPLFICLFPLLPTSKFHSVNLKKFIYQALPFFGILLSFLLIVFALPDHIFIKLFPLVFPASEYAGADITFARKPLSGEGYFIEIALLFAYLFIPSQLAADYYTKLRELLKGFSLIPQDISFTFFIGILIIIILVIIGLLGLINIKKYCGRLTLFSLVALFVNLVFIPFLIQGYGDYATMDKRIALTGSGNGPGIRYVFVSVVGLAVLVATLSYWIINRHKNLVKPFLALIIAIFIFYSYLNIGSHISALKNIHPAQSAIPNGIFSMVPRDEKKKLLYSANPEKNALDKKIGDWLYAFYKPDELIYANSAEEVLRLIDTGQYKRDNFFAFYNNIETHTFKDISENAREEFFDKLVNQEKVHLIQDATLNTSFTQIDNSSFTYILNRGVFVSQDLNKQILSPRILSIDISKKKVAFEHPYVDGFVVRKHDPTPFPQDIWDNLKNKPLMFSIKHINLAFSVKSLNNQLINKVPYEVRLNLAKDVVVRETSKNQQATAMSDVEKINIHYIDTDEILDALLNSPRFNSLGLVYACAEEVDWERQKKSPEKVGGIWYTKELPLNKNLDSEKLQTAISCYGSSLRNIILIGSPFPSEITVNVDLS